MGGPPSMTAHRKARLTPKRRVELAPSASAYSRSRSSVHRQRQCPFLIQHGYYVRKAPKLNANSGLDALENSWQLASEPDANPRARREGTVGASSSSTGAWAPEFSTTTTQLPYSGSSPIGDAGMDSGPSPIGAAAMDSGPFPIGAAAITAPAPIRATVTIALSASWLSVVSHRLCHSNCRHAGLWIGYITKSRWPGVRCRHGRRRRQDELGSERLSAVQLAHEVFAEMLWALNKSGNTDCEQILPAAERRSIPRPPRERDHYHPMSAAAASGTDARGLAAEAIGQRRLAANPPTALPRRRREDITSASSSRRQESGRGGAREALDAPGDGGR
uniref:Uncharacterized protein n=1 Tax=Oryza punctata TaxID=4537 RepID=A0A0E0L8E9_ORYPU